MPIDWVNTAVAVASRLQFDKACGRSSLLSEDYSRMVLVEAIQPFIAGDVQPECNHPDLPGDCRIDLLVRSRQARNIEVAIEHKWVRDTTPNCRRNWMAEILGDLMRVEIIESEMTQGAERILVVAGEVDRMGSAVWDREVNLGAGRGRQRVVEALLQSRPPAGDSQPTETTIDLRAVGTTFARLLHDGAGDNLYRRLPARYVIRLVGHHRTKAGGVECAVWSVSRPIGRRVVFDADTEWH